MSAQSLAAGDPARAGAGARPPPQPAASAAAATEAAVQARTPDAFAGVPYVEPQFQQPKLPVTFTSVTFVPVTTESVFMIVE